MAGLRQQQHGRTGSLGQRPSMTMQGGAQGRGKLQHNGLRTTTGGGKNAKGTGMAAPAKKDYWNAPAGFFQFGHGQWGHINERGMVNWNAKPPTGKERVYGWNQITQNLKQRGMMDKVPSQRATPNPFADDLYTRNMAQHQLDLDTAVKGASHNISMLDFALEKEKTESARDFRTEREQLAAQMGGAGLDESGIAQGSMGLAADKFGSFLDSLVEEHGMKVAKERSDQQLVRTAFDTTKASELGLAKDRWTLENPGRKLPPVRKGLYQQGKRWYYANPNSGVTTTFKPRVKPKVRR